MPIRRTRKNYRKRKAPRRARAPYRRAMRVPRRRLNPMNQYGTVEETISLTDVNCNTPYQFVTQLSNFPRSVVVTGLYQFYRLKYVRFQYQPKYPLGLGPPVGATAANNVGRPMRLYYIMNRQGTDTITLALTDFEQRGAKPIPFGSSMSSSAVVRYKPNLIDEIALDGAVTAGGQPPVPSFSPVYNRWITRYYTATGSDFDNDQTEYQGHFLWIDDYNNVADTATAVAEVRVTACWEYKNPYTAHEQAQGLQIQKVGN